MAEMMPETNPRRYFDLANCACRFTFYLPHEKPPLLQMSQPLPERYAVALRVFFPTGRLEIGRLTLVLIVGSVVVSLLTNFGTDQSQVDYFSITRYRLVDGHFGWQSGLPEIWHGEIWRLITPIFMHVGGITHLVVNCMWMFIFGTLIEKRQGFWFFLLLVLGVAIPSNLAQYVVRGPAFGGMSGVMCGLLGYNYDVSAAGGAKTPDQPQRMDSPRSTLAGRISGWSG